MSTEQDRARELAERIARRLADGRQEQQQQNRPRAADAGAEQGALSATLREIQRRLAHIEAHISHEGRCEHDLKSAESSSASGDAATRRHSPQPPGGAGSRPTSLSGTYVSAVSHPSQERFADIGEAVSELVEMFEREKTCNVEPGGKPCDHCGMCNSRGF
jgi:hypothetical protein